jgi:ABC-type lipoprotein release transport system permease subunit
VFGSVALVSVAVAVMAILVPAPRAVRMDPAEARRHE